MIQTSAQVGVVAFTFSKVDLVALLLRGTQ